MRQQSLRLAVVIASARKGRSGETVSRWFVEQAALREDLEVDVVDVAEFVLPGEPDEDHDEATAVKLAELSPRLAAADMFVFVTPEYNRSFPASAKAVIDWHTTEWEAKPIGFVSYGGRSGGLRAVEQLRQVFAELHAVTIRDTVSFHGVREWFGQDGRPRAPEECDAAAKKMLDQLRWWGAALHRARVETPYQGGVRDTRSLTS